MTKKPCFLDSVDSQCLPLTVSAFSNNHSLVR